ncbi:MAG: hypothetical protein SVX38_03930 [Chloroflexota bacterium]|nr:hypothetical protein [Chloroflexota bacterium]
MIKLLLTWDIKPGQEADYFDFVYKKFGPKLIEMGIQITEAWYTAFGSGPQILIGGVVDTSEKLSSILDSEEWSELYEELSRYIINFNRRVVRATGRFQL